MKSVILSENAVKILKEAEWNYHYGKHDTMDPYVSDNKYQMIGRDTGHFGSGTYFSTYKGENLDAKYGDVEPDNGEFIKIDNNVYRVNMELYKNLYRVHSKRQGDVLYTMCKNLNAMYNRITTYGDFNPSEAYYSNSGLYQEIKANADALGLKCPSYLELTRMAQRHTGSQSFSTLFMEWNGFNGVNVSGIEYYDNTLHGSVIYDLSKVSDDMKEVNTNGLFYADDKSSSNSVVYDPFKDSEMSALRGKGVFWPDKLQDMPFNQALRVLKNYTMSGHILHDYQIKKLDPNLRDRYLRMIVSTEAGDEFLSSNDFGGIIKDSNAWWFANHRTNDKSGLLSLLDWYYNTLDWNMSDDEIKRNMRKFIRELETKMTRPIDDEEHAYIERNYL